MVTFKYFPLPGNRNLYIKTLEKLAAMKSVHLTFVKLYLLKTFRESLHINPKALG